MPESTYGFGDVVSDLVQSHTGKPISGEELASINRLLSLKAISNFVDVTCRKSSNFLSLASDCGCDGEAEGVTAEEGALLGGRREFCFQYRSTSVVLNGPTDILLHASIWTPLGTVAVGITAKVLAGLLADADGKPLLSGQFECPVDCESEWVQGVARVEGSFTFEFAAGDRAKLRKVGLAVGAGTTFAVRYEKDVFTFRHSADSATIVKSIR